MADIQINNACRLETRIVGNEKTPVVIIDDPIQSTDALIEYALQQADFDSSGDSSYPGIRADLPSAYADALGPQLIGMISHVFKIPPSARPHLVHQLYSLVTQQPAQLEPLQRLPHTDNRSPYYFASVHYLNTGDHGGTGFFRHRPTGFERITNDRYDAFKDAEKSHIAANGPPAEKYIDATDDHYELFAEVEYKPNRMAIYPGNILHSGLIRPDQDINADPATGRLTANLFFYFTPA
jgi:hypothetical protein